MIRLLDKGLDKVARKYINFIMCSILGFSIVYYMDRDEVENMMSDKSWDTTELVNGLENNIENSFENSIENKVSFDEASVQIKSYEIVKNIYDDVA